MKQYETLEEIARAVNKKVGDDVVVQGSRISESLPRITTGILAFDMMLGGGWPMNQWSEIVGDESSGMTVPYSSYIGNRTGLCVTRS